mgnify:FL=1
MKKLTLWSLLLVTILINYSCKKTFTPLPPYPGMEVKLTSFNIDSQKDTAIVLSNGTIITYTAGSLIKNNGDAVSGNVELLYREFHDAVDIFLAGIPMDYNSMGEKRTMQTAGMFEIDATQGDSELKIADGKSIKVSLASKYKGEQYNFFYLNPDDGNWNWVDLPSCEINADKAIAQQALDAKKPQKLFGDEFFVLNYNKLLDIYLNDDWYKINKLKNDKDLRKKLEEYNFKYYNINVWVEVKFNRAYYQPAEILWRDLDGKDVPKWANKLEIEWKKDANGKWYMTNEPKLIAGENNVHTLVISDKGKTFSKQMQAIIPLKNLLKQSASSLKENYDNAMIELAEEQKKVDAMAETFRAFNVNRLGIYNFDCLLKLDENWFPVAPMFTLENHNETKQVILIFGDNSGYVKMTEKEFASMKINPKSEHRIIIPFADNQVELYPIDALLKLDVASLKSQQKPTVTFEMKNQKFNDAVEFRKFLGFN